MASSVEVEGIKSCYSVSIPSKLLEMYSLKTIAMSPFNIRYLIRLALLAVNERLGKGNKTIENQARSDIDTLKRCM
jgi:hypothetical protein